MARLQVEFAEPEDAAGISRLLTESTRGFASPAFALDRPDDVLRIMEVRGTAWKLIVARDTERQGHLAAYASVAYRPCYVNGAVLDVPHLLDVFFSPEYRNGMLLSRSFAFVKANALPPGTYAQTQVCVDNDKALGAFTSGRGGLPAYLPYGDHAFITLPLGDVAGMGIPGAAARRVDVRRAEAADIPALEAFHREWAPAKQFYPLYDFADLGAGYYRGLSIGDFFLGFRNGRLAGVIGTWDQQEFKSTHYLAGGAPIPAAAKAADKPLFLHAMLMERNNPAVMAALIDGVRAAFTRSPYGLLALGLDAADPLRYGIEHIPHRTSLTHHFLVTYGEDPRPGLKEGLFYLDSARC